MKIKSKCNQHCEGLPSVSVPVSMGHIKWTRLGFLCYKNFLGPALLVPKRLVRSPICFTSSAWFLGFVACKSFSLSNGRQGWLPSHPCSSPFALPSGPAFFLFFCTQCRYLRLHSSELQRGNKVAVNLRQKELDSETYASVLCLVTVA